MEISKLYSINLKDIAKGGIVAVLIGILQPVLLILKSPGFDFATANWPLIFEVAINGAIAGFASYLMKNFFSDEGGKVLGKF